MEILASILGVMLAVAAIAAVISAFFFWIGGKIVGIKKATFGRAILAAIASAVATWMISWLMSFIPGAGTVLGFILGAIIVIFIIKAAFEIDTYGKAFLVWIFYLIAQGIAFFIAILTFGGALLELFKQ